MGTEEDFSPRAARARARRSWTLGVLSALAGTWALGRRFALGQAKEPDAGQRPVTQNMGPRAFQRVGDLRACAGNAGEVAIVGCHSDPSDEGGGIFCWSTDVESRDDDGTCVVPRDGPRRGCWRRSASGPMNVRWFGALGDGKANDDRAFASAAAAARGRGNALYAPRGRYRINSLKALDCGFTFRGDGPASTVLVGDTGKDHVIELTKRSFNRLTLRDFSVDGGVKFEPNPKRKAEKVFHGIYFHHNNFEFEVVIENVEVRSCSGAGICDETGMFSSILTSVTVDGCGGTGIALQGGCCTTLVNCYVLNIARDQAAYRIATGTPILIGCNGINHNNGMAENTTWAEFGLGPGGQCLPTLLGCNVESFTGVGCNFGGGSFGNFVGTSIVPAVPRRMIALRYAHVPHDTQLGIWDGTSRMYGPPAGGEWGSERSGSHGHPIEAFGNPFVSLNKNVAHLGSFFRREKNAYWSTIPSITSTVSASQKVSLDLSSAVIRDAHLPAGTKPALRPAKKG